MKKLAFLAVVLIAVAAFFWHLDKTEKERKAMLDAAQKSTEPQLTKPTTPTPTPLGKADKPAEAQAPVAALLQPSFDVVRVNQRGEAVIAGRATPLSEVIILDGEKEIGRVQADQRGEWVFIPKDPLPAGNRQLSLHSPQAEGEPLLSKSLVVVMVPENKPGEDANKLPMVVKVKREGGGTTVLQSPQPQENIPLSIDAIDYDEKGEVSFSGKTPLQTKVQLYLDNQFIIAVDPDSKGFWLARPQIAVTYKLHILRADAVGSDGKVVARAEIPFSRAEPINKPMEGDIIIIQPGNSLWRIARKLYGKGVAYTTIHQANKDQIRDPDQIYPGQVFVLPNQSEKIEKKSTE